MSLSEEERAVQRYVMAAVRTRGLQAQDDFERLAALLPASQAVAIAMLAGRYITHALVVNTFGLRPPAVSYTHLDVYKRQAFRCAGAGHIRP